MTNLASGVDDAQGPARSKWTRSPGFVAAIFLGPLVTFALCCLAVTRLENSAAPLTFRFNALASHAYFLCQDFFGENNVVRSANLDKLGVDFQVYLDEQCYNIHIFVDTERAWHFRREKAKYKQGNKIAGLHVNLPYALSPRRFNSLQRLPNGFGVYSQSYLAYLKSEIQSGNIKNDNIIGTTADGFVYQTL